MLLYVQTSNHTDLDTWIKCIFKVISEDSNNDKALFKSVSLRLWKCQYLFLAIKDCCTWDFKYIRHSAIDLNANTVVLDRLILTYYCCVLYDIYLDFLFFAWLIWHSRKKGKCVQCYMFGIFIITYGSVRVISRETLTTAL